MEIPFIATNFKLWKSKFSDENCGVFINPESVDNFVSSVKYLYYNPERRNEMGRNGKSFVTNKYNWGVEYLKFRLAIELALK